VPGGLRISLGLRTSTTNCADSWSSSARSKTPRHDRSPPSFPTSPMRARTGRPNRGTRRPRATSLSSLRRWASSGGHARCAQPRRLSERLALPYREARSLFIRYLAPPLLGNEDLAVVSPDVGGIKRAEQFRQSLSRALSEALPLGRTESLFDFGLTFPKIFLLRRCIFQ
jgi:hypothetical protein